MSTLANRMTQEELICMVKQWMMRLIFILYAFCGDLLWTSSILLLWTKLLFVQAI